MTPHGPDTTTYEAAIQEGAEQPAHLGRTTLAFMFETSLTPRIISYHIILLLLLLCSLMPQI